MRRPQAGDTWAPSSWKRQEGPSLEAREGARPCRTWISEFWPQNGDGVTPVLRLSVCGTLLRPPQDTSTGTTSLFPSPGPRPQGLAQAWSGWEVAAGGGGDRAPPAPRGLGRPGREWVVWGPQVRAVARRVLQTTCPAPADAAGAVRASGQRPGPARTGPGVGESAGWPSESQRGHRSVARHQGPRDDGSGESW